MIFTCRFQPCIAGLSKKIQLSLLSIDKQFEKSINGVIHNQLFVGRGERKGLRFDVKNEKILSSKVYLVLMK